MDPPERLEMLPTFANQTTTAPVAAPARGTSTDAQRAYLRTLMLTKAQIKGMDMGAAEASVDRWLPGLSKAYASEQIDAVQAWLKENAPEVRTHVASGDRPSAEVVPAGRYAVATEDGATNALAFYKVDRPTEGRWAGYVFVKLMLSDEEQRMSRAAGDAILRKIAAVGAEAASAAYGQHIGECGVCGRTLTNDESRAYGIGPDCRKKLGW